LIAVEIDRKLLGFPATVAKKSSLAEIAAWIIDS